MKYHHAPQILLADMCKSNSIYQQHSFNVNHNNFLHYINIYK